MSNVLPNVTGQRSWKVRLKAREDRSVAIVPEMRAAVRLADHDFKTVRETNAFKCLKENVNISRSVMDAVERNRMEFLDLKIPVQESAVDWVFVEEKTSEQEDRTAGTLRTKAKRGKVLKNMKTGPVIRACRSICLSCLGWEDRE